MKAIAQFLRATIVRGVFFLAPIVELVVIVAKAFDYAKKGLKAVLVHSPAASELSSGAATALSVSLVALVCFLAGLLARTAPAQAIIGALELSVLSRIPAYEYLKQESASAGRRRDRRSPRGVRRDGRGMAVRRSDGSAGQ